MIVKFNIGDYVLIKKMRGLLGEIVGRYAKPGYPEIYQVRIPGGFVDEFSPDELEDPNEI